MAIDIVVPQIGEAVAELTLISWLKRAGDSVKKGDVLFEVDSDKAIVEVEAYEDGTLLEILAPAGSTVMPQDVVARLQPAAERGKSAPAPVTTTFASQDGRDEGQRISPVAQRLADDLGVNPSALTGSGPGGRIIAEDVRRQANHRESQAASTARINASPKAKITAGELQVDLASLSGSGVDGMIRVKDVERAAQPAPQYPGPETKVANLQALHLLTKLRQTIASRTAESKQTVPHFYLMADVNMSQVNSLRAYCRDTLGWQRPPTYTDILVRVCALSLHDLPETNLHFTDSGLVAHNSVGIGVAIHTDGGLTAPVIPDADTLNMRATSQALRALTARAREGRLKLADTGPKSLVISNLGMYHVDAFIAIIDMPDPMILAVGQVAERVVPLNGQIVIQPMCTLTLSVDHRALDGVPAAHFLERVKARLENPFDILSVIQG